MRMLVLGAGLQGSACAYDLLQIPEVTEIRLAGLHVDHLPAFLKPYSSPRFIPTRLDVRDQARAHQIRVRVVLPRERPGSFVLHDDRVIVVEAGELGREKEPLKGDVRKLKDLGLTESLNPGYRLSPRGTAGPM